MLSQTQTLTLLKAATITLAAVMDSDLTVGHWTLESVISKESKEDTKLANACATIAKRAKHKKLPLVLGEIATHANELSQTLGNDFQQAKEDADKAKGNRNVQVFAANVGDMKAHARAHSIVVAFQAVWNEYKAWRVAKYDAEQVKAETVETVAV